MVNLSIVTRALAIFITVLSLVMLLPMIADILTSNLEDAYGFALSSIAGLFVGVNIYYLTDHMKQEQFNVRHAFILTSFTYILFSAFGALPFYFSGLKMDYTDAFFESTSGITGCGASVIEGLDYAPAGILLWRALLNWIGGIGIIVIAMSVLPMLKIGGMQLFKTESSESDKILPRASQIAGVTIVIYVVASLISAALFYYFGMDSFDAITHAMSAISTGGFTNYDNSIQHFNSFNIELVCIGAMIASSLPFVIYYKAFNGNFKPFFQDQQIRLFFFILFLAVTVNTIWLYVNANLDIFSSFRYSFFDLTSAITTTGFDIGSSNKWKSLPTFFLIMLPFIGGCTGSTAGGIKIFRYQILYQIVITNIKHLIHPHGVFKSRYNDKFVPDSVATSVLVFFFTYIAFFILFAGILSYDGVDFTTSARAVGASMANAGLGIGENYTYKTLPDLSKWALSAAMIMGRLELFTVLILFMPALWKKY